MEISSADLIAPLVGHVGDGNFHLSILVDPAKSEDMSRAKALSGRINHIALELGGTITGEHGVGIGKTPYMRDEHGEAREVMSQIKRVLDPTNIMYPGKVIEA